MDTPTPPTPPPPPPPSAPEPPYQRPADYYEGAPAAPPAERKGCPKWIPIGCGAGGCLLLLILVIGGFYMFRDGGGGFIGKLLGPLQGQVAEMADEDVTADQKATFSREMSLLREKLEGGSVSVIEVQPIIQEMQSATSDRRITSAEMDGINEMLLEANDSAAPAAPSEPGEEPQAAPEGTIEL